MSGLMTIFDKELADAFSRWRFIILFILILVAGIFAIYLAAQSISETLGKEETEFVFLQLFTTSSEKLPASFLTFIIFFVPVVGIALGFDAINSEKNSGTLSRLLSQPIYRDAVINGKFLAGVITIAILMTSIVLLVSGIGLRMIGVPPSSEEVWRLLMFLVITIFYGSFWLGLAMLFSILFRRVATSALATIAIWIFFIFFMYMIAGLIANVIVPVDQNSSYQEAVRNAQTTIMVMRASPVTLYQESVSVLLVPGLRTMGQILQLQTTGVYEWMLPTPLSFDQSLLIVWPHVTALIALTAICFAASYTRFMREEIRST
jgi:ABC-2 type transport system permease protein